MRALTLALALLGAGSAPALAQSSSTPFAPPTGTALGERWVMLHFVTTVPAHVDQLTVTLTDLGRGAADLYLREQLRPTETEWDFRSASPGTGNESITVTPLTSPAIHTGLYRIGVFAPLSNPFSLQIEKSPRPSSQPGMGAIPFEYADGTTSTMFRVWAPNADTVHVAGSFNGWNGSSIALQPEGNGIHSIDVRGAEPGDPYRFVIRNGTQTLWKNDPFAASVTSSVGDSVIVDHGLHEWEDDGYQSPAWNDLVLYEMHVGTFNPNNWPQVGGFQGVMQRLPYLQSLGVNAVQLMPVAEFAGDRSWGYNYSHPFAVESAYGGVEGLRQLVDAAHQHGIAILLDVLYNHWGPSDLDLWRFDGWANGNWGGIYFYNDDRAITPWGDTKPDFGRGEVRSYIRDNALYWLDKFRVDGLRWDSTSTIRRNPTGDNPDGWSLMQWANDSIDGFQGWKIQIAEDMYDAPNDWITKSTGAGGAGFDSQWDAMFIHPVREAIEQPDDNGRNMWAVRDALTHKYNGSAFQRVIYTESHDEVANGRSRVPEEIWPGNAGSYYSKKRSTLGAALVMTAPGIPMLFQGQEFLEDGYFHDDDPLDWNKLSVFDGIHDMYRDLIHLRRNLSGTTQGLKGQNLNVHHVNDGAKVLAFHRWDQGGVGDDVIVVSNFRNQSWGQYRIGLPGPGTWRVRFNSDWSGYDQGFSNHPAYDVVAEAVPYDGLSHSANLSIGPYTTLIYSR